MHLRRGDSLTLRRSREAATLLGFLAIGLACSGSPDDAEETSAAGAETTSDAGNSSTGGSGGSSAGNGSGDATGSDGATGSEGSGGSGAADDSGGSSSTQSTSTSSANTGAGGGSGGGGQEPEPPACPSTPCLDGATQVSCCLRETVPSGSFAMGRDEAGSDACPDDQACPDAETPEHSASVTSFALDVFEVTVGRFRAFLDEYGSFDPMPGSGAHPLIASSGWQSAWDSELPSGRSDFEQALACDADATYTVEPSDNETLPINCVTWFEAFAFCIYSGGRLPTEAEWEYAAAGGSQERLYPWGGAAPDSSRARFFPQALDVVGAAFDGAGRWGHHDLAGNLWEWGLDWLDTQWYSGEGDPCDDCARLGSGSHRVLRGGAYSFEEVTLRAATRSAEEPHVRQSFIGVRCAASP